MIALGSRCLALRALIVSDIHSNLEAFQAVLDDASARGDFDELWCLGDTVGYGLDPGSCIELLTQYDRIAVVGNHDLAAVGMLSTDDFNSNARFAAHWTARQLTEEHIEFLSSLPEVVQRGGLHSGAWQLAHARAGVPDLGGGGPGHLPAPGIPFLPGGSLPYPLPLPRSWRGV